MKISYLMHGLGESGGSLVLYHSMDHLVDRGHEVYAVLPDGNLKWEKKIWKKQIEWSKTHGRVKFLKYFIYNPLKENILGQNLEEFTEGLLKKIGCTQKWTWFYSHPGMKTYHYHPWRPWACGSLIIHTCYDTEDYVIHGENGLVCQLRNG